MEMLISESNFITKRGRDLIPFKCQCCKKVFYRAKKFIVYARKKRPNKYKYCCKECDSKMKITRQTVTCKHCGTQFQKTLFQIKKHPNHFCSQSCAATYNNAHKTKGCRRSKLEIWIETQLKKSFPTLEILFNDKTLAKTELDIFIPSLKLAFELNGIFHYEPIYGLEKLKSIQNNDQRKFQACLERGIELAIIDTHSQKRFTPHNSKKFLKIIKTIINQKLISNQDAPPNKPSILGD